MKTKLLLSIVFVTQLWASSSIGSSTAQFLEVNMNVRNMGMGNSATSLVDGSASVLVNPAGLVDIPGKGFLDGYASYMNYVADISFGSFGLAADLGRLGTIGVHAFFTNYGDEVRTTPDAPFGDGTFSMSSYSVGMSYARYLTDKFSFGANLKLVAEDYDGSGYSQVAYDLGTLYRTGYKDLRIGMSIQHFSKEAVFSGQFLDYSDSDALAAGDSSSFESWPLPMTFRTGLSMKVYDSAGISVLAAADMIHSNNSDEIYGLGFEAVFSKMLVFRGGYQFGTDIEGLTVGGGVITPWNTRIDYSFGSMEYLGARHRLALSLSL